VGGVAELAAELDVPVVAVVGECFDDAERRLPTVSLVRCFGRERALGEAAACLREVAPEVLKKLR
jgi:hypothetical protein